MLSSCTDTSMTRPPSYPSSSMNPVIAALWGGVKIYGDMRGWEVLQAPLPPVLVLFVACTQRQPLIKSKEE